MFVNSNVQKNCACRNSKLPFQCPFTFKIDIQLKNLFNPVAYSCGLGSVLNRDWVFLINTLLHNNQIILKSVLTNLLLYIGSIVFWSHCSITKLMIEFFFFIVAPCILIHLEFTHQQMHFFYFKKHIIIYIKIHINIAPTCFGLRPSSGSLHWTWLKLYLC